MSSGRRNIQNRIVGLRCGKRDETTQAMALGMDSASGIKASMGAKLRLNLRFLLRAIHI